MNDFSNILKKWYITNKRELPWRGSSNPYEIWLSEIILQQTRIAQGLEYYNRFLKAFPNVFELANASVEDVLKLWQGLGYYSRARNLHETAKIISEKYNGSFPKSWSDLIKLKGIGNYTAAAIASIAFKEPVAAVDGNVYRVLSRIFGIKTPINSVKGKKEFFQLAQELLDKNDPGVSNEALMEFGAVFCTPQKPNCSACPFSYLCFANKTSLISSFPVKDKGRQVISRYFNYLVLVNGDFIYLRQRSNNDIWRLLYDFKLFENEVFQDPEEFLRSEEFCNYLKNYYFEVAEISDLFRHKLTHQTIYARFYKVRIHSELEDNSLIKVKMKDVESLAVPRLIEKYLATCF